MIWAPMTRYGWGEGPGFRAVLCCDLHHMCTSLIKFAKARAEPSVDVTMLEATVSFLPSMGQKGHT